MIKTFVLILFLSQFFLIPNVYSSENQSCSDRYLTLINPVRGRNLWFDKSLKPIQDQYRVINQYDFSATWLLQYDTFSDLKLTEEIKKFNKNQEKGIFLEVSKDLADKARVIYPHDAPWFSPRVVFLSGYNRTERKKLIDEMFKKFKQEFGNYPKSVGSWWVDSYSLNYLKEKYQINSALIVADQLTTDNYGVWGQWWGVSYYPAKANILTPASDLTNKQDVVILQWAQRDPILAYGESPKYSNYSLQANDYIRQGKDTAYFKQIIDSYLDCKNKIKQITVGLETGIESIGYINEYQNQLGLLRKDKNLKSVTMTEYANYFQKEFPGIIEELTLSYQDSKWEMDTEKRINEKLKDEINYKQYIGFADYFIADKGSFLDRRLNSQTAQVNEEYNAIYLLILNLILGLFAYKYKFFKEWLISTLFTTLSFGLIFKSYYLYGWKVYFGPVLENLKFIHIGLFLLLILLIIFLKKIKHKIPTKYQLFFWLIPLSFGLDFIISQVRFSYISNKHILGMALDSFRVVGITFSKPFNIQFINQDFPAYQASALLRFDYQKFADNLFLALVIYPLVHILIAAGLLFLVFKLPKKIKSSIVTVLILLTILYIFIIINTDPIKVLPNR